MAKIIFGEKFYSVPEGAGKLDVSRMTMYRWAKGATVKGHPIRVVQDQLTKHYYVSEVSILELAEKYTDPKTRFRIIHL